MWLKRSMEAKELGERLLKQIDSFNNAVKKAVHLQNIISRNMKETIRTAQALQEIPLPPAARAIIKEYKGKYTQVENLGIIVGKLNSFTQKDQILSYDEQ